MTGSMDTLIDRMAFLKRAPLFSALGIAELGLIAKIADEQELAEDSILIEEGKKNEKLFILVSGHVEVSARLSGEQHGSLGLLHETDCLGEEGIFNESLSSVTAQVTMGPARILRMDGEDLKRLIRLYPEIGIGLLASTMSRLQKLQRMMIRLEA